MAHIRERNLSGIGKFERCICMLNSDMTTASNTSTTLQNVSFGDSSTTCPLLGFIYKNNIDSAQRVLKEGHAVNQTDMWGETPLILACRLGNAPLAELLLQQCGVRTCMKKMNGVTALHEAARNGMTEIVEKLLAGGSEVDPQNFLGYRPLHLAVLEGRDAVCQSLLTAGAKSFIRADLNNTPLHSALILSNTNKNDLDILIRKSPEYLYLPNVDGHTPMFMLFKYCRENVEPIVKYVLSLAITALNMKTYSMMLNHQDKNGRTILHYAASLGSIGCTQIMLAAGAEMELINNKGQTPLAVAARSGNINLTRLFLSAGASTRTLFTDNPVDMSTYNHYIMHILQKSSKEPPKLSILCRNVVNKRYPLGANMDSELPTVINKFLSFDQIHLQCFLKRTHLCIERLCYL